MINIEFKTWLSGRDSLAYLETGVESFPVECGASCHGGALGAGNAPGGTGKLVCRTE